ncbi:phosphoribosylamine--glycine ligase [Treponema sp.]|uniref:phosphoribosylamine--glycine ligase n=1 Tax=Treponema sp. TaxID=166 RepID=UPI0025D27560|nr:phosphoribosylamine--glycine ligase [Treponema sp.]MCR5219016.1 phosphoribosylamine--glycine ligase [Treponema sp.]
MKVAVIGNGGREHTIAWKIAQSSNVEEVICIPGNGGTALENKCRNVEASDGNYAQVAKANGCSLAVVGPENPLSEGAADDLWVAGIPVIGPKKAGAQLEASKDLAKAFMKKYGVACAKSETFTDEKAALEYVEKQGAPIVLKADGLAAGKGVVVALTMEEARQAVKDLMEGTAVGDAGKKLVIEEYLRGVEISVLAAVSVTPEYAKEGKACIASFLSARDHKRLLDGAKGPNTGGMGAICPVDDFTDDLKKKFYEEIEFPTLRGLVEEGYDYRGFIFFGIMLTKDGPKALEYNVRLGDPETQAVLPMMDFDFVEMCQAIIDGKLKDFNFKWKSGYQVAPVAVSGGYPKSYKKGMQICEDKAKIEESGAKIFIAGAVEDKSLDCSKAGATSLKTSGGRVLACSAHGSTFDEAWKKSYQALEAVNFEGMFYRKDIGLPGAAESN